MRPLLCATLVACGGAESPIPTVDFVRPVVLPGAPLSLSSPQSELVTWPIWGGAFTLDGEVHVSAGLTAEGGAGLLVGSPDGAAVALVGRDGGWVLRESQGGFTIQEAAVSLSTLSISRALVVVGESAMPLSAPLAADAGLYAYLEPGATVDIQELSLSQPLPTAAELGTPLRALAAARGVQVGSATDVWPPRHDLRFEALLGEQFDTAAPTELYWATTRGEDDDYFFVPADLVLNYAHVHGQRVTAMFLVWDFELPEWLYLAPDLDSTFDDHITTLVERYRGRADAWVVVNEAVWGSADTGGEPARLADSLWLDALGPAYIERAFHTAHAADPGATLLYNETGAESLGDKADFVFDMLADLVARNVPVHGVGLQFHLDAAAPPDMNDVAANLERFAGLGLDIYITELDVSLANYSGARPLEAQAILYADVVSTCLAVPACRGITTFGFSDRYAWDELGDASPLLFDEDYAPKPAFFAVQSALR